MFFRDDLGLLPLQLLQRMSRFAQGDPADGVFYIQKGKVKIVVTSEQGREAVVAILGAGA